MACSLSLAWRARAAASATPVASARSIHALSNKEGKKKKNVFPENEPGNCSKPGVQQMRSLHSPSPPRAGYEHLPGWQTTPWGTKRADSLKQQYDEAISYQKCERRCKDHFIYNSRQQY